MIRPLSLLFCILLLVPGAPVGAESPAELVARLPDDPHDALLLAASANGHDRDQIMALAQVPFHSSGFTEAYGRLVLALDLPPLAAPADLPDPVGAALVPVVDAMAHAVHLRTEAVGSLTPADWDQIQRLDAAHRASREAGDRNLLAQAWANGGLPEGLDQTRIVAAAYTLLDAGLTAAPALRAATPSWPLPPVAMGAGLCVDDGIGVLIVCGPFDDELTGDHILEIDLGGNDHHATNAGASGLGILWGGSNGLPAALALDLAGDDTYSGGSQVQAAGSTTPGVLIDLEGSDTYSASSSFFTFAQGAGNLGGVGMLYDALGADTYTAPAGRDTGGDPAWDSQGFGILGGIGILHDAHGQDSYIGGIMAQGVGDFNAVGMLLDSDGSDTREAIDRSQGYGDGAGLGLLLDATGDDYYLATGDRSQGAGVGGTGLLLDVSGNDVYAAFKGKAQGWGAEGPALKPVNDVLEELGIPLHGNGLAIDLEGDDGWHGSPGCDLCFWIQGTGIGLDTF